MDFYVDPEKLSSLYPLDGRKLRFETLQVHGGTPFKDPSTNAKGVPIYQSAAFVFNSSAEKDGLMSMKGYNGRSNFYSRIGNPTVDAFEKRVALLENGFAAVATSSGQSAQFMALTCLAAAGDNIVGTSHANMNPSPFVTQKHAASTFLYGGTHTQFTSLLKRYGIIVKFANGNDPTSIEGLIDENTKAVYCESISNPRFHVSDIPAIAEVAHRHGVPLVVDNTLGACGFIVKPLDLGADIVVASATKWIGGHGTTLGGVIVDSGRFDWGKAGDKYPMFNTLIGHGDTRDRKKALVGYTYYQAMREKTYTAKVRFDIMRDLGACLTPQSAWTLIQGLETLSLRVERHQSNALAVARYLEAHPKVAWVAFPGLPSHKDHELAKRLLNGFGSVLSFGVKGGQSELLVDHLKLHAHATNLGSVHSLVVHPASTTHGELTREEREAAGVTQDMLRVSVGTEHIDDITSGASTTSCVTHGHVVLNVTRLSIQLFQQDTIMQTQRRSSSFGTPQQEQLLKSAETLKSTLENANLQLLRNVTEFQSWKLDPESDDTQELDNVRDPAIGAANVAEQVAFLRKLKFQYLEQNAKDRYVKSIVSDIDDAPIVTAEDNKELIGSNTRKKEKLKVAKSSLEEMQSDIRALAPLVETDYKKVTAAAAEASSLGQHIIDARLALTRLRKTHPHPRLTVQLADQKLVEQVEEMQSLNDELDAVNAQVQAVKEQLKRGVMDLEGLRTERAEVEKAVKMARADEDDARLVPLYSWYTASTHLHRSLVGLQESYTASDNELRFTYGIDPLMKGKSPHRITITLIFAPDTRRLAAVQTDGLEELGVDVGDIIEAHLQSAPPSCFLSLPPPLQFTPAPHFTIPKTRNHPQPQGVTAMLDSSPVAMPPVSRPLKRSASVASLPTPPRTYHKRKHAARSLRASDYETDCDDSSASEAETTERRRSKKQRTKSSQGEDAEEQAFWMSKSDGDLPPTMAPTPAVNTKLPSGLVYRRRLAASASTSSVGSAPMSPPPSNRKPAVVAAPVTPERRSKRLRPMRDSPNNPFLVSPATVVEDSASPTPSLSPHTPRQQERPTVTYVFRGVRGTFPNPLYDHERNRARSPSARSRLPIEHPEYSPDPHCPPKVLFPQAPRKSRRGEGENEMRVQKQQRLVSVSRSDSGQEDEEEDRPKNPDFMAQLIQAKSNKKQ
ncbi:hypothetical protein H0H93_008698 [Arthromyces matolae]|nr:hypothetical protein H0H93_008698 [Arthromyces matolae]